VRNPDAKAAGCDLAKAAHTITSTINLCLLPLAAVNFAYKKAEKYFGARFQKDIEEVAYPRRQI
jgi:hypothetical protein